MYEHLENNGCSDKYQLKDANGYNLDFDSFIEAKEYCSSEPNCFGVQNKNGRFYVCSYPLQIGFLGASTDLFKRMRSSGS